MKSKFAYLGLILAVALTLTSFFGPANAPKAPGIMPFPFAAFAASDQGFNGSLAKTASYSCTVAESGTVYTNRGASGAVTFTLPAVSANVHYLFLVHAAQNLIVAADTVDTLITYNDVDADSVTSNTIGAAMWVWCDGTSWFLIPCTVGVTYTVTD